MSEEKKRSVEFVEKFGYSPEYAPYIWGSHIMDKLCIGGVFIGNRWLRDPSTWGNMGWLINDVLPASKDDMALFLMCKMRMEIFLLAVIGRWDALEKVALLEQEEG